jgi:FdhE protein
MTREAWLRAHPFLVPLARLHDRIDTALARVPSTAPALPAWDDYLADYIEGVPLLRSRAAAIDLEPAGRAVCALVQALGGGPAEDPLARGCRELAAQFGEAHAAAQRVAAWLLGEDDFAPSAPGLLRHLGWTAMARTLAPLVEAFGRWRNEERWLRRYCPTCGSLPAMAWLVGVDPGHQRFLLCGCCRTRWRWRRTACPFCEHESHRLAVMNVESEPGFRIDWCESCRGYLKAYQRPGNETVALADWTTLHLDVAAVERNLQRTATSLYDLAGMLDQPGPSP